MTVIPKKSLGQHWLFDDTILSSIVAAADIKKNDTILEVGPGLGTLTKKLLQTEASVYAVEKDDTLAGNLRNELNAKNLKIYNEDISRFDLTSLPTGYKVVANIPYYLTSKLIRNLTESTNPPESITLLVQKEVAERICARPGQMSLLSISSQLYYNCLLSVNVPRDKFTPPPKVDSQVVHLLRKDQKEIPDIKTKDFFRVVKAGFSSRRKTLLNSLSGGLAQSKDSITGSLEKVGISPGQRPQELSLEQWALLANELS